MATSSPPSAGRGRMPAKSGGSPAEQPVRLRGALSAAVACVAAMAMVGGLDLAGVFAGLNGGGAGAFHGAFAAMLPVGAGLAALPGRIRRRFRPRLRSSWRGCLSCFAGGFLLLAAAGMAQMGDALLLVSLAQGSLSALAFVAVAWPAAAVAAYLHRRWRGV